MTNNPVLIAYCVKDKQAPRRSIWTRIGVAFPHDKGAGLTVILNALPPDGRLVLVEPRVDPCTIIPHQKRPKRSPPDDPPPRRRRK